jgi:hypothetical protein
MNYRDKDSLQDEIHQLQQTLKKRLCRNDIYYDLRARSKPSTTSEIPMGVACFRMNNSHLAK